MSIGDIGSLASAVVAFVALIFSVISIKKANKFGETADRLNLLLIGREQADGLTSKQADVSARVSNIGKGDYRLKIFNRGKGVAKNVRLIDLDMENSVLIADDIQRKFPIPILEQDQSVELIAAVTIGSKSLIQIRLIWDDETGLNREKELTPAI